MTSQRIAYSGIHGVIVPLLTPLNNHERIDEAATRQLVEYVIAAGVHGLFPMGTTGEGPLFSDDERMAFAELVIEAADGRLPVIVHTGAVTTRSTVDLTRHARKIGAAAASVITPWYFHIPDAQLVETFVRVCDSAPDFPIYLYNNPGVTGNHITADIVQRVYARCTNLAGLKDSGGSLDTLFGLQQALGDSFNTAIGPDGLICSGLSLGLHATVSGNANVVPHLVVALYEAAARGDFEVARALQARLNQVRAILRDGRQLSLFKAMLTRRGIPAGPVRAPLPQATDAQIESCFAALEALGVWERDDVMRKEQA